MIFPLQKIRNFALIAHVDHGKSTLADRLIEICQGIEKRDMQEQVLDAMDIERERGITIKAQCVRLGYQDAADVSYRFHLLDTPGHVDFSYEVGRSLSACEASLLLVDATQGVEAQTIATVWQAVEAEHHIIPVLNKMDLPTSRPEEIKEQLRDWVGLDISHVPEVSAKTGEGVPELLKHMLTTIPPPRGDNKAPLQALVIDSWYDKYLGVVTLVRVRQGVLRVGMIIKTMSNQKKHTIDKVGYFSPKRHEIEMLQCGDIGFITASIKDIRDARVGDTITTTKHPCQKTLQGFRPPIRTVFCSFFPHDAERFEHLRKAAEQLSLNDAGFAYEIGKHSALGLGLHCGFLGLLHMDVIRERFQREFSLSLITTTTSVTYRVTCTDGKEHVVYSPMHMPETQKIVSIQEPWIRTTIMLPGDALGSVIALCQEKRGVQHSLKWIQNRTILEYDIPLGEVAFDFYDRLKSCSRGHGSMDYNHVGYRAGSLKKVTFLINQELVEAFSFIGHVDTLEPRARAMCHAIKEHLPKQMFKIPIQATIGAKVIARETIAAFRKDVTAKLYGGDVTRKKKLLEKQKKGKKRMRTFGSVEIPAATFTAVLKARI